MTKHIMQSAVLSTIGIAALIQGAAIQEAAATGFAIREGSADWLGNAFAGTAAKAYDASTAYSNPAGMSLLEQSEVQGNISYIDPRAEFSGTNTIGATTTSGTDGGQAVAGAATSGLFGVWRMNPNWSFGFAMTVPYGQRVSYDKTFVGRYQGLVSSITDVSVSPSIAYKIDDHWSIGGGPVFNYMSARLTNNLYLGSTLSSLAGDPVAEVTGEDMGIGFNVGVLYRFDDKTRIGLDYRSRIHEHLSGDRNIYVPAGLSSISATTAATLNALTSSATAGVTLPDNLNLGIYHQLTPKLAVMGSVEWTNWSLLKSLVVKADNGTPSSVIEENWRDAWFFGIGANYQLTDSLLLQTGFSYEQSPVTNSNRTSRIPDGDHYVLGVGATYSILPNVDLSLAYAHIFVPKVRINDQTTTLVGATSTLSGTYNDSADSVTAGITYRF